MNPLGQILAEVNWHSFLRLIASVLAYTSWALDYILIKWTKVAKACLQESGLKYIPVSSVLL